MQHYVGVGIDAIQPVRHTELKILQGSAMCHEILCSKLMMHKDAANKYVRTKQAMRWEMDSQLVIESFLISNSLIAYAFLASIMGSASQIFLHVGL